MRCSAARTIASMFSAALVFGVSAATAQDPAVDINYPIKKIKLAKGIEPYRIATWTITGKKTSHLSVMGWDNKNEKYLLSQFKLSHKGKAKPMGTPVPLGEGYVARLTSVLIKPNSASRGNPTAGNHILVFALVTTTYEQDRAKLLVMAFDENGKSLIDDKQLMEITAPENNSIIAVSIYAAKGPRSVGVAFSLRFWKYVSKSFRGMNSSRAFFFETDDNGKLIGNISEIGLPKGGNLKEFWNGIPRHNGAGWIAPAFNTNLKIVDANGMKTTSPTGNELYVITVTGSAAPGRKIRLRRIFKDNQMS